LVISNLAYYNFLQFLLLYLNKQQLMEAYFCYSLLKIYSFLECHTYFLISFYKTPDCRRLIGISSLLFIRYLFILINIENYLQQAHATLHHNSIITPGCRRFSGISSLLFIIIIPSCISPSGTSLW